MTSSGVRAFRPLAAAARAIAAEGHIGLVETFADLEERAVEAYQAQSPEQGEPVIERLISMRYEGQNYEQEVPVPNGDFDDAELADCYERYHQLHESFYGYRFDAVPIEMVRIGVAVSGEPPSASPLTGRGSVLTASALAGANVCASSIKQKTG